jgi:DNA-directed RNA polymerase subunit alpha
MNDDEMIEATRKKIDQLRYQLTYYERILEVFIYDGDGNPKEAIPGALGIEVRDMEFSVRTSNVLYKMGIKTFKDLISVSEQTYLKEKNFGRKSLNEIKEIVAHYGYTIHRFPIEGKVR